MIPKGCWRAAVRSRRIESAAGEDPACVSLAWHRSVPRSRSRARPAGGASARCASRSSRSSSASAASPSRRTAARSPSRSATPDVEANTSRSAIWMVPAGGGEARPDDLGREAGLRSAILARRPQARVPLQPRRRLADLGAGPRGRRSRRRRRPFRPRSTPSAGRPTAAGSSSPRTSSPTAPTPPASRRRSRRGPRRRSKARVAERLLFRRWDSWKDGTRTHIWKIPARRTGPAVDLTPGDRDAPPFAVGGGEDWDVSPDATRARLRLEPRPGRGALDQRRPLRSCRSRAARRPKNLTVVESRIRRLAALLARRKVDRVPRPEARRASSRTASA